jgi:colanic acid/amylovoran biosynthesis glycosyltransferase
MSQKLNICVVYPNRGAYSETFIRNHIKYLPGKIFRAYGAWMPEFDGNDVKLIDYYRKRNILSQFIYYLVKLLPVALFNRLSSLITLWPINNLRLQEAAFKHYLISNNINAVLAEYGVTGAIIYHLCKQLDIPLIVHFHGYDAHHKPTVTTFQSDYQKMFESAKSIIVVSAYMHQRLIDIGASKEKIYLNYYGIDVSSFEPCNAEKNPPYFTCIGRFVDKKAPYLVILAFVQVISRYPESRLFFIGDGILLESCKNLAESLGLKDKVIFMGVKSPDAVRQQLTKSRAFVLHSLETTEGDSEGTPNVVIEAMASGLPIISTRHAGIMDIVAEGECGFLVKEKDIEGMANNMIKFLSLPSLASEMGGNGRKFVEEKLSMEKSIRNLYQIILKSVKS